MYIYSILSINTFWPHYLIHVIYKRPARNSPKCRHIRTRERKEIT